MSIDSANSNQQKRHDSRRIRINAVLPLSILLSIISLPLALPIFAAPVPLGILDPKLIPKFVDPLVIPPIYSPEHVDASGEYYTVDVTQFNQKILPTGLGQTSVWGYGGTTAGGRFQNAPGATFEATKNTPVFVRWQNLLTGISHQFAVDPTLHWADPNGMGMPMAPFNAFPPGYTQAQSPVPIIPHLHGGEVQSTSDGHPEAWFTSNGLQGPAYNTNLTTWWDGSPIQKSEAVFKYPNPQPATTLWYHDHALGITRLNVMSGLAGFYILRDTSDPNAGKLPSPQYEVPIVVQDRTFKTTDPLTGRNDFWFPNVGLNPTLHPYWMPEFFGNTIMVNGKTWPYLNVNQRQYRLRLLDGSNARFYTLSFWIPDAGLLGIPNKLPFTVIGTDGGYLNTPVTLKELTIAPGERYDIIVDFSTIPTIGATPTKIVLRNTAKTPFPNGAPADPQTVGQIMQFNVQSNTLVQPTPIPTTLNNIPTITGPIAKTRILTLIEVMGPAGPAEILLDGQKWDTTGQWTDQRYPGGVTELPKKGDIEEWVIVNPTADTHPIHLHLVQFQLVSRQPFQAGKYLTKWMASNPVDPITGMPPLVGPTAWPLLKTDLSLYLQGKPVGPPPQETGWKDTIQVNPGEVTVIRMRFKPIDGTPSYPFDPTLGPGYVWHCHILDHEDNEMMRPYKVMP